jgi:large subunit ribosomal protein L10
MAISRTEKEERIEELVGELQAMSGAVFTDYRGLTVKEMNDFRSRLREAGVSYRVVKYTLLALALERAGIKVSLRPATGPLGLATGSGDITGIAKSVATYAKENEKLEVTGGILDGEWAEAGQIKQLALLPSREELYAKAVGSIAAPLSGLVGVLSAVPRGLVSVLSQYQQQKAN